ncbi:MAG: mannose-1-phosphate guanylyltransferase [Anaerolineae bacterium]|nr:mannose-1-phosphate guanylyltransferase [Anaerolineae bacterium]
MFALILAGGTGTRLWPRSRRALPKQLLDLGSGKTMMQDTVERILPIVEPENIFVATNYDYGLIIKDQVPQLRPENIIAEPSGKNTAPCIGLAAMHMNRLDPKAVMASLHADHFIADEEGFRQALLAAEAVAREGYLVTLGITPDKPETGYGYIKRAESVGTYNNHEVYQVEQFLEKPDLATAQRFLDSGEYYWNSGIFIWQLSTLLESFRTCMPAFAKQLEQLGQAIETGQSIEPIWEQITPESIDEGIMERAAKVAVVPIDVGWNDVGSWAAIHEINDQDENGNVIRGAEYFGINTTGSLIQGKDRLIATVGLEDVIIIDSGDALLVCAKDSVQDIKKIVNWLEENNRQDLL